MVEVNVFGLALDEDSQMPILILKDAANAYVLPVWIGPMEAIAISMALNKVVAPRPMTHDLALEVMRVLEGNLDHVEIVSLEHGTYHAALVVSTKNGVRQIDSRPSDAIALALKAEVPIMASKTMLEEVVSHNKEEYQAVIKGDDAKQWTEILARYHLDDSKYKM